ncbi:hypothetical protein BU23DRAFT_571977 [Bimuria novae-zelandiae CBS 107.79]|uniref:Uncharacterized protein n=1 Tax=Bimuria novae-zelandiae CBS 107.79 TaxID=1447943 RepID=A0A6A5UYJ4_9PLEO|nr:hypothetical protein BU23DRAFT_571977 [Bimuria novae-zelandiae CBS 107.79]
METREAVSLAAKIPHDGLMPPPSQLARRSTLARASSVQSAAHAGKKDEPLVRSASLPAISTMKIYSPSLRYWAFLSYPPAIPGGLTLISITCQITENRLQSNAILTIQSRTETYLKSDSRYPPENDTFCNLSEAKQFYAGSTILVRQDKAPITALQVDALWRFNKFILEPRMSNNLQLEVDYANVEEPPMTTSPCFSSTV